MTEHSAILIDGIQRGSLLCCPHCGGHFLYAAHASLIAAKQSEISDISYPRIYCRKCDRLTCGRPGCDPSTAGCIPREARMEFLEGKKTSCDELILSLGDKGLTL